MWLRQNKYTSKNASSAENPIIILLKEAGCLWACLSVAKDLAIQVTSLTSWEGTFTLFRKITLEKMTQNIYFLLFFFTLVLHDTCRGGEPASIK